MANEKASLTLADNKDIRLQKKIEKREKQRISNVLRAQKMHLARLEDKSSSPAKRKLIPKINVGCSGWFYWHWREKFYDQIPTKLWFQFYRENFGTVELNAPFYSWPTINTVKTWVTQTDKDKFIYTIKVPEMITHLKKMSRTQELIKDFYFTSKILKNKLGCFLFQFPPSFKYSPARIKRIVSQLDPEFRNVVEFRHKSWWTQNVYDQLKLYNIIFCSCSSPNLPNELIKTANEIYIRFHGLTKWYKHDYSTEELKEWVDKIKILKPKRIWVYFNNDNDAYAIKNAKEFMSLVKRVRF